MCLVKVDSNKYPHSDLAEKIIGLVFAVFNELKFGYKEKFYQRALAYKLEQAGVPFVREQYGKVEFDGKIIGQYYVDFVVDDKVVVELKVANEFFDTHTKQIINYLTAQHLRIGLLFLINPEGVKIKRLIR